MVVDMVADTHPMARKRIVVEASSDAPVERVGFGYRGSADDLLEATLYRPSVAHHRSPVPAVILVSGYPDPGFQARMGCVQPEMGSYVSWAELFAAAGMAAITYRNQRPEDAMALLRHVHDHARELDVDRSRIGLWACSGSVPNALGVLITAAPPRPRCAALCYGFVLDVDGHTTVAEAARTWGFAHPNAGRTPAHLPDVPLLLVRAGADETPGLNDALDRFIGAALAADRALRLVNVRGAPHAFDLLLDTIESHAAIRQVVDFLRAHLLA